MATLTAIRNKKQTLGTLAGVLGYVAQPRKTMLDNVWLVTGSNCVANSSYLEMLTTKRRFCKTGGQQFFHFVQSFDERDDLTPQEANAIGVEFAQREFPGYEVVVATHVDTNHLHNHLVVDGVSCETGKKLHQNAADLQRLVGVKSAPARVALRERVALAPLLCSSSPHEGLGPSRGPRKAGGFVGRGGTA